MGRSIFDLLFGLSLVNAIVISICIGVIPGFIGQSKGRDFLTWWLYGAAVFIVALPHSLMLKPDQKEIERERLQSGDVRKCPFCAEIIKAEAVVCRFCGRDLPEIADSDESNDEQEDVREAVQESMERLRRIQRK